MQALIVEWWRKLFCGVLGKSCTLVDEQTYFGGGHCPRRKAPFKPWHLPTALKFVIF